MNHLVEDLDSETTAALDRYVWAFTGTGASQSFGVIANGPVVSWDWVSSFYKQIPSFESCGVAGQERLSLGFDSGDREASTAG